MRRWLDLINWFIFWACLASIIIYAIVRGDGPPLFGVLGL